MVGLMAFYSIMPQTDVCATPPPRGSLLRIVRGILKGPPGMSPL